MTLGSCESREKQVRPRANAGPALEVSMPGTMPAALGLRLRAHSSAAQGLLYEHARVEYWGGGRAAALTHTSVDGARDLALPDNVQMYFLSGTQHLVAAFPPERTPDPSTPPGRSLRRAVARVRCVSRWSVTSNAAGTFYPWPNR
jgi:hypothetical protein